ncbi:40S ribosomal protein S21e, putative [Babesia bigemina]|uniref:40S ribosomal protein S21 n=1 Tax=Babesia bigemina TaxID=5866 RepID=A0A061D9I7_BABBI|nr:40S ribosomal protein S21e, putative [Babesia bigemina]CDR96652.1 40S ribosomal protein S21e, putative [Babesia bigemina]|eukprot:XP_012768838.1 40S ribosomal protein S21e, putative [Babesia bigemina]
MINDDGKLVDLYIPRKCSATSRLLPAQDHGSIQVNIGMTDENGVYNNQNIVLAISHKMRLGGDADEAMNRLFKEHGLLN